MARYYVRMQSFREVMPFQMECAPSCGRMKRAAGEDEEELELDEESGLRQMEMHTLNQLNSLLKPERRAPKRQMPCGLGGNSLHSSEGAAGLTASGVDGIEFNMKLIREVRERSYLYDVLAEAYNNPTWRISAWNDVAIILDCTSDQVKTRWKTLRDKFKKEDKKVRAGETSCWAYYEAMEFLQPHLRDKNLMLPLQQQQPPSIQQQSLMQQDMFGLGRSEPVRLHTKWNMEDQSIIKDMDDSPSSEKKLLLRVDEDCGADAQGLLEAEPTGSQRQDGRERTTPGGGGGEYQRDIMMRMGARHLTGSAHSQQGSTGLPSPVLRWNAQDEDEVFGHMIALRLTKMDPRFKESIKVKLLQTLYEAQFGPDSPQSLANHN